MFADTEVIALAMDFLFSLGIDDLKLHINSIGCTECRAAYKKVLQDYLRPNYEELCDTCKDRFERNPMRILDCKSPSCQMIFKDAPRMIDYICEGYREAFDELQSNLTSLNIDYTVDTNIVRGLDYYTKTAFEILSDKIGAQATVCGGGRYDHLIQEIGGPQTPGVGFGLGMERLLLVLEAAGIEIPEPEKCNVFIATLGDAAAKEALKIAKDLRAHDVKVITDVMQRSLKAQLKYADRLHADYTIVIGDDELSKGVITLRDMRKSEQNEINICNIYTEINL
jgi:histidyl-tRNA synthetase